MAKKIYRPKNRAEAEGLELTELVNEQISRRRAPASADLQVLENVVPNGRLLHCENAHTGFSYVIMVQRRPTKARYAVYETEPQLYLRLR